MQPKRVRPSPGHPNRPRLSINNNISQSNLFSNLYRCFEGNGSKVGKHNEDLDCKSANIKNTYHKYYMYLAHHKAQALFTIIHPWPQMSNALIFHWIAIKSI